MNTHRYTLFRNWLGGAGQVNWIMLNPSTATEYQDDPTIRKCIGFSKRWGYQSMIVTNLFAFRATNPDALHCLLRNGKSALAVGDGNDREIANAANESDLVVVAWGANAERPAVARRVADVLQMFLRPSCIGHTAGGHPIHPCMAGYTEAPVPFLRGLG